MDIMSAIDEPTRNDPTASSDDDSEFARLKRMVLAGHRARSDWLKETRRAFDFVAGWQWSDEDKALLDSQKRPAVTFNRCAPIIKAVCGLEVNNRQNVVFLPRKEGDGGPDEVRTAAAKWARDECQAEDEESTAFRDNAICGEGWTETRMDYDEDPQGKIIEERIDPIEMGTNKGACKANYSDARLIYRARDMEYDDVRYMFDQEYSADALHAAWMQDLITPVDGGPGNKRDYPDSTRAGLNRVSGQLTTCRVVQVQWWERETHHMVAVQGAEQPETMPPEDFKTFQDRAQQAGIQYEHTTVPKRVYYEAFLGSGIIEKRELPMGMFNFRAMTGERDRTKKCFYGMLRDMFDPQMWANKWLSQTMQILNSNAKGGIMAESDAFANVRKAEADWSDPTKIVWTKPGAISKNKIKDRNAPPLPQGLGDLMTFAISSLRDVTGVNLELLGQADREQAASLEMQRRQSAMTILATLFDSLRRYRKSQGRLMLHFIELLPDGTLVRVIDKGMIKYIPLVKQGDIHGYDVIVDEAPSSPDQKQAVWVLITQLLQSGVPLSPPVVIKLLKYSPLPESVVQEIEEAMGMGQTMPPEMMQQKLQQAEAALHVLEQKLQEAQQTAKTAEDDRQIEMMKLEIDEYKAQTTRLQAQWTAHIALNEALADASATPTPEQEGGEGSEGQSGPDLTAMQAQIQQLTGIVQQLLQAQGQPQGQAPEAPPPAAPPIQDPGQQDPSQDPTPPGAM